MKSGTKGFALAAGIPVLLAASAVMTGAAIFGSGFIVVRVDEKGPDGQHIRFAVPAAVVPLTLRCLPDEEFGHVPEEARRFLPVLELAADELAKMDDFTLVEVRERDEHVRIHKRGGSLVIEVDSMDETVYVRVPLGLAHTIARHLGAGHQEAI
ncbi:MAG: hypothetical protein ACE5HB_02890 [Terriglobia bacterium]